MNTSGKVYKIDPTSQGALYRDDGVTYSTEVRTSRIDFGSNDRTYVQSVSLIADTQSTGSAYLYFSDDDYQTWKGPFTFDLTKKRKQVNRIGAHYEGRAYKLVHYDNAPFRAEALEFTYRKGIS